jgi:rRNA-processing protein FCF1
LVFENKKSLKIILDTNFFFIPSQYKLNIFEELGKLLNRRFTPVVLSSTRKEIQGLVNSNPKISKQAIFALKLIEKCSLFSVKKDFSESFDDIIVRIASDWKCPVATNDKELKTRLRKNGIPVIFLRQKHRFEIDGAV